jgi:hypothetical protein
MDSCIWETCLGDYNLVPDEVHEMQWHMFRNAVLYFVLALYLNEVIPQTYGVPKHPLFFVENLIRKYSPALHLWIFGDNSHLESFKDESELKGED